MLQAESKQMATSRANACPGTEIASQLRQRLSAIGAVESVCLAKGERAIFVWVGIREDNRSVAEAVYRVEDEMSERYRDISFDFHIIPLPSDRKLRDFVSVAQQVFERAA